MNECAWNGNNLMNDLLQYLIDNQAEANKQRIALT